MYVQYLTLLQYSHDLFRPTKLVVLRNEMSEFNTDANLIYSWQLADKLQKIYYAKKNSLWNTYIIFILTVYYYVAKDKGKSHVVRLIKESY